MGIFTRPKPTLSPTIFYAKKMRPTVRQELLTWVHMLIPKNEVQKIVLIGSAAGYKWDNDSDIDLQVILSEDSMGYDYWFPLSREYNKGAFLKHTKHKLTMMPKEPRPADSPENWAESDFEAYDVTNDVWLKEPIPQSVLVNPYQYNRTDLMFSGLVKTRIQLATQNMVRAFNNWKKSGDDSWLQETYRSFKELADIFFEIDRERKLVYSTGLGIPRYSAQNIIFKYIEKMGYAEILQEVYRYLRDTEGEFVDKEI